VHRSCFSVKCRIRFFVKKFCNVVRRRKFEIKIINARVVNHRRESECARSSPDWRNCAHHDLKNETKLSLKRFCRALEDFFFFFTVCAWRTFFRCFKKHTRIQTHEFRDTGINEKRILIKTVTFPVRQVRAESGRKIAIRTPAREHTHTHTHTHIYAHTHSHTGTLHLSHLSVWRRRHPRGARTYIILYIIVHNKYNLRLSVEKNYRPNKSFLYSFVILNKCTFTYYIFTSTPI